MVSSAFTVNGQSIKPGTWTLVDLPLPPLYTHTPMTMPIHVIRGYRDGPRLFVCAAIHGDELNGIEIIRRLLKHPGLQRLRGTLMAIPMVNVYGVIHHSRYLPDRRDLNRSFPGSNRGAMASRLAHLFMSEIVANSTHGIDLHTGAVHRTNLPHIRANLDDEETLGLAKAFGAPLLLNATLRDGSLREAAAEYGIPTLLYEAGEALRFDEVSIRAGVMGVLNVLRHLGMVAGGGSRKRTLKEPFIARSSGWIRAPASGIFRTVKALGSHVRARDVLGVVSDPFSDLDVEVTSPGDGIVIGRIELPLVHEGEALYHVARFEDYHEVAEHVENFQDAFSPDQDEGGELPIV